MCCHRLQRAAGDVAAAEAQVLDGATCGAESQCQHGIVVDGANRAHQQLPELGAVAGDGAEDLGPGDAAAEGQVQRLQARAGLQELHHRLRVQTPESAHAEALQAPAGRQVAHRLIPQLPAAAQVHHPQRLRAAHRDGLDGGRDHVVAVRHHQCREVRQGARPVLKADTLQPVVGTAGVEVLEPRRQALQEAAQGLVIKEGYVAQDDCLGVRLRQERHNCADVL
mmetsp:Transcript_63791/g.197506  ORF Transcript_63791/g.197506 Transcript_63791/m.197506 type:complete len:224 (+) Transcript_63791:444-1115(+)